MPDILTTGHGFESAGTAELRVLSAYRVVRPRSDVPLRKIVHPFWVVSARQGEGELYRMGTNKGPWLFMRPGRIALLPPGIPYWQNFSKLKSPMRAAYITFMGGESAGLDRFFKSGRYPAYFADPGGALLKTIGEAAGTASRGGDQALFRVKAALCLVVDALLNAGPFNEETGMFGPSVGREGEAPPDSFSGELDVFLSARIREKISVGRVAAHFKLSVPGLFKRCRAEGVESPMKRFLRLKVAQARLLMQQGESLKSVADRTGFWDAYHLSKVFKKITGQSPRQYRATAV